MFRVLNDHSESIMISVIIQFKGIFPYRVGPNKGIEPSNVGVVGVPYPLFLIFDMFKIDQGRNETWEG